MHKILEQLNPAQQRAVSAELGNILVLAGAGSGKTRVLIQRIAYLIKRHQLPFYNVLALTFTNKAAAEMRQRLEEMFDQPLGSMWVGTFHGICHRLLRINYQAANLSANFTILDAQDQQRLIKRIIKDLNYDSERIESKQVQWFINAQKDAGRRAEHVLAENDYNLKILINIYHQYQKQCDSLQVVDFAELLLRTLELLRDNQQLLAHYQQKFKHILVDEFQDTNTIQYALLKLLIGEAGNLFAVGDDDQSIYGWRGAKIENIHRLSEDFKPLKVIKLEQNYRSSANILQAANALIKHNQQRMGKTLFTAAGQGELLHLYRAFNEVDEAKYVAARIVDWVKQGNRYDECAVLYRSNVQSRAIEEELIRAQIPYRVYGGLRFFERAEIKDALAYLRLCKNTEDDNALERIINMPPRGIGVRTLENLRQFAADNQVSLFKAIDMGLAQQHFSLRAAAALADFASLIETISKTLNTNLQQQVSTTLKTSGLYEHYQQDNSEQGRAKLDNLKELITAANGFATADYADSDSSLLDEFLAHAVLEAGDTQAQEYQDSVQLMTLHLAKGLEFDQVFLVGMEDGLFPHYMSLSESEAGLQEERRLAYVGLTRAKHKLYLLYAEVRRLYGKDHQNRISRFIGEIPPQLMLEVRPKISPIASRANHSPIDSRYSQQSATYNNAEFKIGQNVRHHVFGDGVIVACEDSAQAKVAVNFAKVGKKWLALEYAKLQII